MRATRFVPFLLAGLIAACGSTHPRNNKAATINAALRRLQAEVEQGSRKLDPGGDVLGRLTLVYPAPPKGITTTEWQAAIKSDWVLQRVFAAK